jgi:hypothetical protein
MSTFPIPFAKEDFIEIPLTNEDTSDIAKQLDERRKVINTKTALITSDERDFSSLDSDEQKAVLSDNAAELTNVATEANPVIVNLLDKAYTKMPIYGYANENIVAIIISNGLNKKRFEYFNEILTHEETRKNFIELGVMAPVILKDKLEDSRIFDLDTLYRAEGEIKFTLSHGTLSNLDKIIEVVVRLNNGVIDGYNNLVLNLRDIGLNTGIDDIVPNQSQFDAKNVLAINGALFNFFCEIYDELSKSAIENNQTSLIAKLEAIKTSLIATFELHETSYEADRATIVHDMVDGIISNEGFVSSFFKTTMFNIGNFVIDVIKRVIMEATSFITMIVGIFVKYLMLSRNKWTGPFAEALYNTFKDHIRVYIGHDKTSIDEIIIYYKFNFPKYDTNAYFKVAKIDSISPSVELMVTAPNEVDYVPINTSGTFTSFYNEIAKCDFNITGHITSFDTLKKLTKVEFEAINGIYDPLSVFISGNDSVNIGKIIKDNLTCFNEVIQDHIYQCGVSNANSRFTLRGTLLDNPMLEPQLFIEECNKIMEYVKENSSKDITTRIPYEAMQKAYGDNYLLSKMKDTAANIAKCRADKKWDKYKKCFDEFVAKNKGKDEGADTRIAVSQATARVCACLVKAIFDVVRNSYKTALRYQLLNMNAPYVAYKMLSCLEKSAKSGK